MTRKDRLYKNVQKMQQEKGIKNFNFIPTTFLLPYEFEEFSGSIFFFQSNQIKSNRFFFVLLFSCIST